MRYPYQKSIRLPLLDNRPLDFHLHRTCSLGGRFFLTLTYSSIIRSGRRGLVSTPVSSSSPSSLVCSGLQLFKCLSFSYPIDHLSCLRLSSNKLDPAFDPLLSSSKTYVPFYRSSHLCIFIKILSPALALPIPSPLVRIISSLFLPSLTLHHPGHCRDGPASHSRGSRSSRSSRSQRSRGLRKRRARILN